MATTKDNRFVDHVESKLLSPTKESFTPSKGFLHAVDLSKQPVTQLDTTDDLDAVHSKEVTISNDNHGNESFVDRQESIIEGEEPDVIASPHKVVDSAFNFIESEAESLDAVNNNSEMSTQCSDRVVATDIDNANLDTNQYLGKEVILHNKDSKTLEKITEDKSNASNVDDASVNLYWYSTNLNIDQAELEAFKKSQDDSTCSSTMSVSFHDRYDKDRLGDSKQIEGQDSKMLMAFKEPEKNDTWSQAFESASSHFLDVASSLKSEPKTKKNIENTSIKQTCSNHPWGLENNEKVIEIPETTNELPCIVSELSVGARTFDLEKTDTTTEAQKEIFKTEMQMNFISRSSVTDDDDDDLDDSDAVGYMEAKDREQIKSIMEEQKNKMKNVRSREDEAIELDDCDAVGYMELKDRDEILQSLGDRNTNNHTDQVDAIGYMELSDRPIEEAITSTDNKVAHSAKTGSNILMQTTEKYAQSMSKKIVSSVTQGLDKDDGSDVSTEDSPDGSGDIVEEVIESKVELVTKTVPQSEDVYLSHPVEIKRKFNLSSDTENKLKELGAKLVETQLFVDEYLDDSSFSILLQDCWLRLRNKRFQMKLKANWNGEKNVYPESDTELEIKEILDKIFSKKRRGRVNDSCVPLDVMIDELGLTEFVTIETTRKTYQLDDHVIDLDLASLGPPVGDISVVINRPGRMVSGLQELDQIAKRIGMHPLCRA